MFTLKIKTTNAATENPYDVAELVEKVANNLKNGATSGTVYDYNGNKVGEWAWN